MTTETYETRACYFRYDARGFVQATMKQGLEMHLQDAQEATAALERLCPGQRVKVLVDSRGLRYQSKESREHFVSAEASRVTSSVAILVGSPVSHVIGHFFLRYNRPSLPTRLFTDMNEAISWLLRA